MCPEASISHVLQVTHPSTTQGEEPPKPYVPHFYLVSAHAVMLQVTSLVHLTS